MENYVGKRLDGRYEIQDIIGVGGMAVVYKAYDNIDDRIVAVKVLKDEFLANEEFRRRFKNESKAIAVLSHPNIVKVFDVSFGDRLQYIVMEYIEGITLKEYIEKRGVIDWNEALFFIIQILRALQHAHDKGIVHRDVKPQNIMLLENGTIKVADFGIARFSHSETRTVTEKALGSVHYMSPEQAKGELTDEKADIYSVGVALYEMLTGKLPFDSDTPVSVALMQINNEPELPRTINEKIPVGFEQITMKAMQKNVRDRYQTAAEMLLDLEEFKRNPNIKFDYQTYFVDKEPTRYIGKIQERTKPVATDDDVKIAPPIGGGRGVVPQPVRIIDASEINNESVIQDVSTKKFNTKTVAIIGGVCVAIILFVIALIIIMAGDGKISFGGKIETDRFIGLNYETQILTNPEYEENYNFEVYYATSSDGEEGCVYDQDPKAGTEIPKGSTIRLFIVKAGEGQVVPDFSGMNYKQAYDTLITMGFSASVMPVEDDGVPAGQVIRTEPAANSTVLANAHVTVYYAADTNSGKLFKMPKLEGKSLEDVKEILSKNGLLLSKTEVIDSTVTKDYVISQSPADGSPVKEGDTVTLTVSSGCLTYQKQLTLPRQNSLSIKVVLDGETVKAETISTVSNNIYTVSVSGDQPDSELKVYLNDAVFYDANVDFTRSPVKVNKEATNDVAFYENVVGLSETEAVNKLNAAGYNNVTVVYEESYQAEGTVIKQSPDYSTAPHLDKTAAIVLTVSKTEVVVEPSPEPTTDPEEIPEEQ
ncbi:MAG: Stk1 family PASTA domain-containing Ser/Thr kinase [Ruminococcaceae bacterium]|nr:Stk1 family PASTA domain-containing Ser/Thr kinase [Oscillospiraceae bacterium]